MIFVVPCGDKPLEMAFVVTRSEKAVLGDRTSGRPEWFRGYLLKDTGYNRADIITRSVTIMLIAPAQFATRYGERGLWVATSLV